MIFSFHENFEGCINYPTVLTFICGLHGGKKGPNCGELPSRTAQISSQNQLKVEFEVQAEYGDVNGT